MLASAALAYPAASPLSSLPHSCDRSTFSTLRPAVSACTMDGFPVRGSRTPKSSALPFTQVTAVPPAQIAPSVIAGNGHPAGPDFAGHPGLVLRRGLRGQLARVEVGAPGVVRVGHAVALRARVERERPGGPRERRELLPAGVPAARTSVGPGQ